MSDVLSGVRARRAELGLTQSELARRVQLSRQAVAAIETGRHVPSTTIALRLAGALRCRVEDLFALRRPPPLPVRLSEPSTGRVALGRVDGHWVAHPIARDRCADAVVVRADEGRAEVEAIADLRRCEETVFIAGCAPLLGVFSESVRQRMDTRATWIPADSGRALDLLAAGEVHVAGLHLADATDDEHHRAIVRARFAGQTMVIVGLARWRQGLAVAPNNPLGLRGAVDTLRADVRFVHRRPGSGAAALLDRELRTAGLETETETDARAGRIQAADHAEAARLVRLGLADAAIAFEGAALDEGLEFIPLAEERFDLVLPKARLQRGTVADAMDVLGHRMFRTQAAALPYDLGRAGEADTVAA